MSRLGHFKILLWKNWILQKRKYCVSVFEIILPLAFWGIMLILRSVWPDIEYKPYIDHHALYIDRLDYYQVERTNEILFTPNNLATRLLVDRLIDKVNPINQPPHVNGSKTIYPIGVFDENEMLEKYRSSSHVLAGIVFDKTFSDLNAIAREPTVTLRLHNRATLWARWNTDLMYPRESRSCRNALANGNYDKRFMPLQKGIMASLIELRRPDVNVSAEVDIILRCMSNTPDHSFVQFGISSSVLLVFAYLLHAVQITKSVVIEKQRKLKVHSNTINIGLVNGRKNNQLEALRLVRYLFQGANRAILKMWLEMTGVASSSQWGAWFVKFFIQITILSVILTVLGVIPLRGNGTSVLRNYDPSLFFILLLCYCFALISFCFMISTFFHKASHASVACAAFSILFYAPFVSIFMRYQYISVYAKMAASLLFNVALGLGCEAMYSYHIAGKHVGWSNFFRPPTIDQDYSLILAMLMLLIDGCLYLVITWYVEGVYPGPSGVARPWNFPFKKSYWRGCPIKQVYPSKTVDNPIGTSSDFFQPDPTDKELGIAVLGLRKVYGSGEGKKVAVDDMVLNVYKGHITALLGHNGAGKTTTLSMLTGFLPPTSGTAVIDGFDVNDSANDVTQIIGLCPQDDILFDGLTVQEHITFFSQLKSGSAANPETVHTVIWDLGLDKIKNTVAERLSGGERRKLSVAIALCTSAKIVILDEPTSGMDPQARRHVWSTLQKHKADKAILFTTHNMDEADSLSDRVAIMSEGVVKCSGSPLFLKNKFGVGYHLLISKGPSCDVLSITTLVKEHIPSAVECYNYPSSLMMMLPTEHLVQFDKLFLALEQQKERLGIQDFSTSFTTLEDVFLRVGKSDWTKNSDLYKQPDLPSDGENATFSTLDIARLDGDFRPGQYLDFNDDLCLRSGISLSVQQFTAGVYKKYLLSLRNPFIFLVQVLTIVVLTSVTYGIVIRNLEEEQPISMDMNTLWENKVAYTFRPENNETKQIANMLLETFKNTKSQTIRLNFTNPGLVPFLEEKLKTLGIVDFSRQYFMAFAVDGRSSAINVTGLFDGQSYHGAAIVQSHILNGIYKYYFEPEAEVRFVNHPFPPKTEYTDQFETVMFFSPVAITFVLGLVSSTFIVVLLWERNSRAKHIQIVCGLKPWLFWLSNFAWDFLNMTVAILFLLVVMAVFGVEALASGGRLGYVFVVLMMYCWAVLPYTYLWSFAFRTPTCGFIVILLLNILFGPVVLVCLIIVEMLVSRGAGMAMINVIFSAIFPNFAVGISLADIATNFRFSQSCQYPGVPCTACCRSCWDFGNCRQPQSNYLSFHLPGVGIYVLIMFVQGIVLFLLTLAAEYNRRHKSRTIPEPQISLSAEDEDVTAERTRVKANASGVADSLILHQLSKTYKKKTVTLHNLSLGVGKGECFGLLGVNGAGKSTIFNILTGEKRMYGGEAIINGHSINTNIRQVYGTVGYCPQRDSLFHQLTGREILTHFSRIKGISGKRIKSIVDSLLTVLYLEEYADTLTEYYSYGNKRKLSTAIALLGDPQMLLLDEPTAGVDPVARRRLWNVLTDVRAAGRTILLTSHSMEECDVLCSRLGIMVNGRMVCLGSPKQLKNKFGQGYTLTVRIKTSTEQISTSDEQTEPDLETIELLDNTTWVRFQAVERMIKTSFSTCKKIASTDDTVKYCLIDPNLSLSSVFRTLKETKDELGIADYSLNQSSLEDVFLHLSNTQLNQATTV